MKKPAIVSLSSVQRQEVVNTLDEILKENNYRYKDLVLETLDFVKVLMEELKSGKISTNQLKQILLSLDQEALKNRIGKGQYGFDDYPRSSFKFLSSSLPYSSLVI